MSKPVNEKAGYARMNVLCEIPDDNESESKQIHLIHPANPEIGVYLRP